MEGNGSSSSSGGATSSRPRGFESWRLACEAITGLSRYPTDKAGGPSRVQSYPIHSVAEPNEKPMHLGRPSDMYEDFDSILDEYEEDDEDKWKRGLVTQWKDELLRTSPMVRFMSKHLSLVGCSPHTDVASSTTKRAPIAIAACPPSIVGGFSPSFPDQHHSESIIVICSNRIMSKKHLEDTLSHEMIHWWDHCRFQTDWSNLRHLACSEIRAAALSGDCRWGREIKRRQFAFRKQFQACAKRRAILSVESSPLCSDRLAAERAVDEVWESCFRDTRPFDEVY